MLNNQPTSIKKQQGAALIVCLVVLLIVTILAASGITSASLQQKMAANIQQKNETFQATESGIALLMNLVTGNAVTAGNSQLLSDALSSPASTISFSNGLSRTSGNIIDVSTSVKYLSNMTTAIGNSIDADESSTIISGHRFIVTGKSTMPSGATTRIELGLQYD